METSFIEVWSRIIAHKGDIFHTKTGKPFSYEIDRDYFLPSRTEYRISKSDFERVYPDVPFEGPGIINLIVRDPSYIWAVLHDPRISQNEW